MDDPWAEAIKREGNELLAAGDLKLAQTKYEKTFHNLDGEGRPMHITHHGHISRRRRLDSLRALIDSLFAIISPNHPPMPDCA